MSLNRDVRVYNADSVTDLSCDDFHTYWFMTVDVNLKCVTFGFFVTSMSYYGLIGGRIYENVWGKTPTNRKSLQTFSHASSRLGAALMAV